MNLALQHICKNGTKIRERIAHRLPVIVHEINFLPTHCFQNISKRIILSGQLPDQSKHYYFGIISIFVHFLLQIKTYKVLGPHIDLRFKKHAQSSVTYN